MDQQASRPLRDEDMETVGAGGGVAPEQDADGTDRADDADQQDADGADRGDDADEQDADGTDARDR